MSSHFDSEMQAEQTAVIGNDDNFWLYSSKTGFDLTRPSNPTSSAILPRVAINTSSSPIVIDPAKSALVIIDMQNFFLSTAFERDLAGPGHKALKQLSSIAVPAARKAGIRIIWLNWGLTQHDIDMMPPAIKRALGVQITDVNGLSVALAENGKKGHIYRGFGADFGRMIDPISGKDVDAGRMLMRDQWNSALYPPFDEMYKEGRQLSVRPDVWIHKNRMSGIWGARTDLQDFLDQEGIRTLLLAGVNTDQCVGGTLQDAFSKGYDCVLLRDGAGTSSPEFAQQCVEHNCNRSWGFVTTCSEFAQGVDQSM